MAHNDEQHDGRPGQDARMSRRSALKRGAALGLAAPGLAWWLAACGGSDGGPASTSGSSAKPYGGTGVADRAVDAAKALGGGSITLVYSSGNAGNFDPFFDEWKSRTGIGVKSLELPGAQYADKIFSSAASKTSSWDLVANQPRLFGDLVGAGAIKDLTEYVAKYDPGMDDPKTGFMPLQRDYATKYDGKVYGLESDGDNFIYVYRKDLFEDPKEQAAFEAKFGYALAPATTWDEYRDIAEFFTRDEPRLYGATEIISAGWSFWWWQLRFASKASPQAYYFDDDMNPLVNTPEGISALEDLVKLKPYMPKDVPSWDLTQTYALMGKGEVAQETAWASIAKFANGADSKIKGNVGTAPMPGTKVDGKLVSRSLYGYGGSLSVWSHSKNPEAAYLFAQWISSPEMASEMIAGPGFSDPYRINNITSPKLKAAYTPEVMADARRVAEESVPEIMIKGSNEYCTALDEQITRAYAGQVTPAQAMANVEKAWNATTKRLGRAGQQSAWRALKKSYPSA
jgi:multiple sugar transport system substrate-binding protein